MFLPWRWKLPPSLRLIWPSVAQLQRYCCWYVTWPCDIDVWPFDLGQDTWRVTWSIPPPILKILRLSILELWLLIFPIGYHWQCDCSHCACAVSRDLCVGGKFSPYIWNPWPRFAYPLYNFYGATIKINGVIRQNSPTHAQNHFSLQRCPNLLPSSFSATTISR